MTALVIFSCAVLKCCRAGHKFNSQLYKFVLRLLSSIFNDSMKLWEKQKKREKERERGGRINSIKFFNFPYISYDEIDVCHKCLQTIHRMGLYDFHRTIQIQLRKMNTKLMMIMIEYPILLKLGFKDRIDLLNATNCNSYWCTIIL